MSTTKNGLALAARLVRSNPSLSPGAIERTQERCSKLCRHAATLTRLAEAACNRPLTRADNDADEAAEARCRELVKELVADGVANVVAVVFQGDPRGAVVKLKVSDRSGDWFGGDDYIVVP